LAVSKRAAEKKLLLRLNRIEPSEGGGEFVGLESEGAGTALVGDAAVGIDQVNAVGPTGILPLGGVAEFVEDGGELDPKLAHAEAGDGCAFLLVPGTCENDFIFNIALHLPDVAGVRFSDVDHQKGDLVPVLLIELVERGDLPAEGWSGIAAEDQHRRLLAFERSELDLSRFVDFGERKIGSGISDAKIAGARVSPQCFKWEGKKDNRAGHPGHDAGEGLGWLAHGGIDRNTRKHPDNQQRSEDFDQRLLHRFWVPGATVLLGNPCSAGERFSTTSPQNLEADGIIRIESNGSIV
jgi:hypothetical protein